MTSCTFYFVIDPDFGPVARQAARVQYLKEAASRVGANFFLEACDNYLCIEVIAHDALSATAFKLAAEPSLWAKCH